MTKKATKPAPKKAAPKKRKPTQLDRIEDRLKQMEEHLHVSITQREPLFERIESTLAVLRSGASFMQEREQAPKPIGLQPGDYCEASKDVADELTAMGWPWTDNDRTRHEFIRRGVTHTGMSNYMCNIDESKYFKHLLDRDTFLARARVTAAELGLTGVKEEPVKEPEPWKPQVGDWVVVTGPTESNAQRLENGSLHKVTDLAKNEHCGVGGWWRPKGSLRPASSEEVAKKVPKFGDRVMYNGDEYRIGCDEPTLQGFWRLCKSKAVDTPRYAKRSEFTIIN